MADSWKNHNVGLLLRLLTWPMLIAFALLSMAMALQWLFTLQLDGNFLGLIAWQWLLVAVCLQLLTALVMIFAWNINLQRHGLDYIDLRHSAVMIGLNSIGKYTPGKVLGVLAKGTALYKMSGDGRLALQATLVEQAGLLHSGGAAAALAWLFSAGHNWLGLLFLPVIVVSVVIVSRSGDLVIRTVARVTRRPDLPRQAGLGFRKSYGIVFATLTIVWALSALTLYFCVEAYSNSNALDFWWLLWIIALSYMAGFLAFFTPAGLGAREGVMLVMLSTQMDASVALYISILHRLITLLVDILLGTYALVFGKALLAPR